MIKQLRFVVLVSILLGGIQFTLPSAVFSSSDLPEEALGYEDSSYGLSRYETVNLANGNLTFRIPLYTLRTDGGLSYDLALFHNSKMWETRPRCLDGNIPPNGECKPGIQGNADDRWVTQEIATGIESYGFGWDLRPPRLVFGVYATDRFQPRAWVDPSGAKHYVSSLPPWAYVGDQAGEFEFCAMTAMDDQCYTVDGSNMRLTVKAVGTGGPTEVWVEAPDGTRFIHNHIVEQNTTQDIIADRVDVRDVNFRTEIGGLYVGAIEKGPFWVGVAANRIEFSYREAQGSTLDSKFTWLIDAVCVDTCDEKDNTRRVDFDYTPVTYELKPPLSRAEVTVPVLDTVSVPAFGPDSSRSLTSSITMFYKDPVPSGIQVSEVSPSAPGAVESVKFHAPILWEVRFPDNGGSFTFENGEISPSSDSIFSCIIKNVTLPSGAEIDYFYWDWPVSGSRCVTETNCAIQAFCGSTRVDPPTPGGQHDPSSASYWQYSDGVSARTIRYNDSSTAGSDTERTQTTEFTGFLACPNTGVVWPYDFHFALDPVSAPSHSYKWTHVATRVGDAPMSGHAVWPAPYQIEIHRFNPGTGEEFSTDYFEVIEDSPLWGTILSSNEPIVDHDASPYQVLRHERITHTEKFDVGTMALNNPHDPNMETSVPMRYSYLSEKRVLTDVVSDPGHSDVLSCTESVDPASGLGATDTCAVVSEVTEEDEVDDYLNIGTVTITSSGWLSDIARTVNREFKVDSGDPWYLSMMTEESTCEGVDCTTTGRDWDWDTNRKQYLVTAEYSNPAGEPESFDCSSDCIEHQYGYDTFGNLQTDTVSGGYGPGFDAVDLTTWTTWEHGRPVKKEFDDGANTLLLWQRDVDPWSMLTRWHVAGDGNGFAYNYDGLGRVTDIAPVEGTHNRGSWALASQTTPPADGGTEPLNLYGVHIDYLMPDSTSDFIRHEVSDANCSVTSNVPSCTGLTSFRTRHVFDGQGRKMQVVEQMPGGAYRTRFDLSLYDPSDALDLCQPTSASAGGLGAVASFNLASNWIADDSWPDGGCADPSIHWTESQPDGLGRVRRVFAPDGSRVDTDYIGDQGVVTTRSIVENLDGPPVNVKRLDTKDPFGRLVRLEEQMASTDGDSYPFVADYVYDEAGRLTDIDLHDGTLHQTRKYSYSDGGFLYLLQEPERNVGLTSYDALGNLRLETVSGSGATLEYEYDDLGRPTGSLVGSAQLTQIEYGDASGYAIGHGGYNQVTKTTRTNRYREEPTGDVDVEHQWLYGGPGRRVSARSTRIEGFGTTEDAFNLSYDYDQWGNLRTTFYPEWMECRDSDWLGVFNTWDGSWLTSVAIEPYSGGREVVGAMGYLTNGRIGTIDYGTGSAQWTETADPWGMSRPSSISLTGSYSWDLGSFAYDGSGNIIAIGDKRYAYDGVNRLAKYSVSGTLATETYEYDRWGNMTELSRPGVATWEFAMETESGGSERDDLPPSSNRAVEVNYNDVDHSLGWDARGNLESIEAFGDQRAKTFVYSNDDRLLESTDRPIGGSDYIWRYAYDASGERVARWSRSGGADLEVDLFIRDEGGAVVSEWRYIDPSDGLPYFDLAREYVSAGSQAFAQMDYVQDGDELRYMAADHLGSTRVLFDSGGLIEDYDFHPFGAALGFVPGQADTKHLFTGHERDTSEFSTQMDYMHARYYSPNLGRFVSVDPVGGSVGSSQSWNRYSYSLNNPILFFDPDGRQEVTDLKPSVPSRLNPLKVFRGFWGNQVMMIDDSENKVQSAADLALEIAVISSDLLPSDSARALTEIQSGQDRPNVRDPGEFKNDGRGGTQVLPTHDQQGNPIEYTKHTVNPRTPGVGLDDKRIVTGSDGSVYYTGDHYETWQKVEDDKEKEERKKQQGSQFHRIDDHAGEGTK